MATWVFINDCFVDEEKAVLNLRDLSFLRGYGVFDFFRLAGEEPLFLDDHLRRFHSSAEGLHLSIKFTGTEIKNIISELITRNNLPATGIRLSLTGGYSADGYSIAKPNFIVSQHSFTPPDKRQIEKGVKLVSYPYQRQLPHIKTIDYLMAIWLQPSIKGKGFDDVLYHHDRIITECPRSNIFLVTNDDTLITPAENILAGVTRNKVLEVARKHFKVETRAVNLDEIKTAKEAFITSTTKQILPVAQIDETFLPGRKITTELLQLFQSSFI